MRILLLRPRGFCAGVEMAVRCLEVVLQRLEPPIYAYHQIIHNRRVVDSFTSRGVVFVDDVTHVPYGATLVFSAHGVSPAVRQQAAERELYAIDATCPLVAKVHAEAVSFARDGYTILLIGHKGHDETIGVMGEARDSIMLVESVQDIDRLDFSAVTRLAWLTQTTLSVDDSTLLINRMKERWPQIVGPSKADICYATQNRQHALRNACAEADLVLVVGSQNSSNSRRLAELAEAHGVTTHLVDNAAELQADWFYGVSTLAVTAGASAPESSVREVIGWLSERFSVTCEERTGVVEPQTFSLPLVVRQMERELVMPSDSGL